MIASLLNQAIKKKNSEGYLLKQFAYSEDAHCTIKVMTTNFNSVIIQFITMWGCSNEPLNEFSVNFYLDKIISLIYVNVNL